MNKGPPPAVSNPANKRGKNVRAVVHWFDVLFIMALCFLTLLSTMLLRGKVLVGAGEGSSLDYSVGVGSCVALALIFVAYFGYMLVHSEREWKEMVNHVYGEKPAGGPPCGPSAESPDSGEGRA